MPILILLAFLCIPIAEIAVFIKAGQAIGVGWTLAIVVLTAVAGTALLRRQGLRVLSQTQQKLDRGELPVGEMFDGVCLLVAGVLLLTPGFITDSIGLLLFIPPVRRLLGTFVLMRLMKGRHTRVWVNGEEVSPGAPRGRPGGGPGGGPIIDGDYTDVTERDADEDTSPKRLSGEPGSSPWRRDPSPRLRSPANRRRRRPRHHRTCASCSPRTT